MELEKRINLVCPLTMLDGTVLTEIIVPRPKNKHLKLLPEGAFSGKNASPLVFSPMISSMLNLSDAVMGEMDAADMMAIVSALNDFLAESRPTG